MVSFVEGSEEKGPTTLLVDVRARVGCALGEFRLQVRLVFVVAEEGLEVRDGPEFGAISRGGEALGLEGGGEVVVERLEDGVVVGGTVRGDTVLEEGRGWCWARRGVDGADGDEKASAVSWEE